ncbi:MAG: hypothetical protein E2598_09995 [Sphingobium sp.]|nr:hypothetical protein [Sphingobium sp.]
MTLAQDITRHYKGEWHGSYGAIPTPGHSISDRGTTVKDEPSAPDGVLVNSFNGGDPLAIKDQFRRDGLWQAMLHAGARTQPETMAAQAGRLSRAIHPAGLGYDLLALSGALADHQALDRRGRQGKPQGSTGSPCTETRRPAGASRSGQAQTKAGKLMIQIWIMGMAQI